MDITRLRTNSDKRQHASFIDFSNNEELIYCDRCNSVGIKSRLGPRILEENEIELSDYHQWRQCYQCGKLVNIQKSVKHESKLIENIEINSKPIFTTLESNKKRKHKVGIKRYSSKLGINEKDKEIAELIRKGYDVTVHQ